MPAVAFVNGRLKTVIGSSTARVNQQLPVPDCLFGLGEFSLLSVSKLAQGDRRFYCDGNGWQVRQDDKLLAAGAECGASYWLSPQAEAVALTMQADEKAKLWHQRLAHDGTEAMERIEEMVDAST